MRTKLILLFTGIILFVECSSIKKEQYFKKNQYDALNDFLETKIINEKDKIIIIKEKEIADEAIKIFRGDFIEFSDSNGTIKLKTPIKEGGIDFPLYDEESWIKMKYRYGRKEGELTSNIEYWSENDFKHKNIEFVYGAEFWEKLKSIYMSAEYEKRDKSIVKVFSLSTPIKYKKKYLTFLVSETDSDFNPMSHSNKYIVVMEKIKEKWIVIQTGYDNVYH